MERPSKCITVTKAKELQKVWEETRGREIAQARGYQDTREFWYSIDELQEYLDYVREKSAEQKVENPGIRIYFGAYPEQGKDKSYSTIFLSPTKGGEKIVESSEGGIDENNYEIDPLNTSTGGYPPRKY